MSAPLILLIAIIAIVSVGVVALVVATICAADHANRHGGSDWNNFK
jgi:hypothetical protein